MKNLFMALLALFLSLSLSAKTVVIGNGSGTISQTSMSGLSAGDVLAITPGTYSSATFSNLSNISIINNGGLVTFTGGWSFYVMSNVTISGNGTSTSNISYG